MEQNNQTQWSQVKQVKFHHRVKRFYYKNLFRKIYTVVIIWLIWAYIFSWVKYASFADELPVQTNTWTEIITGTTLSPVGGLSGDVQINSWDVLSNSWDVLSNSWDVLSNSWDVLSNSWDVLSNSWDVLSNSWDVLSNSWDVLSNSWDVLSNSWDMQNNPETVLTGGDNNDTQTNVEDLLTWTGDNNTSDEHGATMIVDDPTDWTGDNQNNATEDDVEVIRRWSTTKFHY